MKTADELKELSVKEFTKAATLYDSDFAGIYEMCKDDYPPILAELETTPFDTLLDAGCGTAPMLSLLTAAYPDRHFTGLDLTPAMIEKAREKNLPNTTLIVGDCENMPFDDACFDVIINSQSFHHYPDPQAFFDSVARVLRPGGKLVLRDNTTTSSVLAWLVNHVEMPLAHAVGHGDVRMHTLDEVRAYCTRAGLTVEKLEAQKGHRLHLVARKSATET